MTTKEQFDIIMNSSLFRLKGPEIDILESIDSLCACINDETETDWYLGEGLECSLGDFLPGAYWALTECHAGQWSASYSTMCTVGAIFNPGCTSLDEDNTGEYYAYEQVTKALMKGKN